MPTLYVTEPGSQLEKEAGQLLVTKDGEVRFAVPAARVDGVVVVGGTGVTTPALGFLLDRGIDLVFLTAGGAFRGRLSRGDGATLEVRRRQYRRAEDEAFRLALGKAIVAGKIGNARARCLELDATNDDPLTAATVAALAELIERLSTAATRAEVMGIEGQAARAYFAVVRRFLRPPWTFPARNRRPPRDPVNALLSLAATLLHENCRAAIEAAGLDPLCGFLHEPRPGRAALALDLMEEFRPVIADAVVLALLNKRMLRPEEFAAAGDGGVRLTREGWATFARQYARRLQTPIRPPGVARRITYQKLLEAQARQLRRVILGEEAAYEPFRLR